MRIGDISGVVPDLQTGQVQITLDAARRVTLEGSLDDPRVRRVLLYAVKSYDNPGIRRDTLDCLRAGANNPDVREALLYAMGHDSNPGVRLEAMDVLRGLGWGADSRQVFLDALQHDTNAGLRAAAVDELVKHADREVLPVLQRLAASDSCRYVRLKCASALREVER
jgi:HEAT repeat protein